MACERGLGPLARQRLEGLAEQLERVVALGGGRAGGGRERLVVDELVAVCDKEIAGRVPEPDSHDSLVQLAELSDQGREVAVPRHDDEAVDVRAAIGELHRVDGHLNVGAILGALLRGGHLDQSKSEILEVVPGVPVAAPIGVGAFDDHAPLVREPVEDEADVEIATAAARPGHVLVVDQDRERAFVLGHVCVPSEELRAWLAPRGERGAAGLAARTPQGARALARIGRHGNSDGALAGDPSASPRHK